MKRIFKQFGLFILAAVAVDASADEGEMYSVSLNGKPQVLIILDTSTHMKKESKFPYPEYYDPHIAYPPIPDSNTENFVYKSFLGGEQFYYNRSSEAQSLDHERIRDIAKKAVDSFTGGPALTSLEQDLYDDFVKTIPAFSSSNRFSYSLMNCYSALDDFQGDAGAYQDNISQLVATEMKLGDGVVGIPYHWKNIGDRPGIQGGILKRFVDCQQDIADREKRNPGYEQSAFIKNSDSDDGARDGYQEKESRQGLPAHGAQKHWNAYGSNYERDFDDSSKAYIYADNLVKWARLKGKQDSDGNIELSNLQIAKKVILDLMLDIEDVDSGLEIFNPNNAVTELNLLDNNGGRIISGIRSYDIDDYEDPNDLKAAKSLLKKQVGSIFTTGLSRSALCESLYEGYRYLYGKGVYFGDDFNKGIPKRDVTVEKKVNGEPTYISPLDWKNSCQTEAYIIMVSAGYHDVNEHLLDFKECEGIINDYDTDKDANQRIRELEGITEADIAAKSVQVNKQSKSCDKNLLPVLSSWLATNDIDKSTTDVKERIVTYTVGIGDNMPAGNENLLKKTAEYGDGEFYKATSAHELRQKLEMAFADIISRRSGTAATVATSINSTNSTKSNEFVYYSMFQPNQTSRWSGNLRKLKVTDDGVLSAWTESASKASATTKPALVQSNNAYFSDELYSGWSNEKGLNDVKVGGVVEAFNNRTAPRNVYITNANNTGLLTLNKANLFSALNVDSDADLANALGVSEPTLAQAILWLEGKNESGEFRNDIFGDPMHSEPLIVEYPDTNADSEEVSAKPRIFIGTNSGFFHAFKDNGRTVEEEWAFIPKENLARALKLNLAITKADNRIYGIDGTAVAAQYLNDDGKLKHVITFGERRGGQSYYSLNVNLDAETVNTTKPTLNWIISGDSERVGSSYLADLAQSWSTPVVGHLFRGPENAANDHPVLFFGGGYDEEKDTCGSNGGSVCADVNGRAIYIIDVITGHTLHKFENGVITDSIASELAVMDSDSDGYIDRIYAPDTGGNVYRADLPISFDTETKEFNSIDTDSAKWQVIKLAKLGGVSANDRRFFSAPTLVRARDVDDNRTPYDGLLLGSGDITAPNKNVTARNYFFNIKDTMIYPQSWGEDIENGETPVPAAIEMSNLKKLTYNSAHTSYTAEAVDDDLSTLGWAFSLNKSDVINDGIVTSQGGEKSLGGAVVINGIAHFNTYSPFTNNYIIEDNQCIVNTSGNSHYYQVNLNSGLSVYYKELENIIAKDITVHAISNESASIIRLLGVGKGEDVIYEDGTKAAKGTIEANVSLTPRAIYNYNNEDY